MIREVTMYRVVCDHEGCEDSPQEHGDYAAWADTGTPHDEAVNSDWFVDGDRHLCPEHAPLCAEPDCGVTLWDAEFGRFCEDHAPDDDTA